MFRFSMFSFSSFFHFPFLISSTFNFSPCVAITSVLSLCHAATSSLREAPWTSQGTDLDRSRSCSSVWTIIRRISVNYKRAIKVLYNIRYRTTLQLNDKATESSFMLIMTRSCIKCISLYIILQQKIGKLLIFYRPTLTMKCKLLSL